MRAHSWVGVFSVIFLKRTLTRAQWVALVVCMAGVGIVGASSLIGNGTDADGPETASEDQGVSPLVGVALVLVAQIFSASRRRLSSGSRRSCVACSCTDSPFDALGSGVAVCHRGAHHGAPHGRAPRACLPGLPSTHSSLPPGSRPPRVNTQLAAGYEGVSGLSTTMIGLFAISYLYGTRAGPYFDVQQGWHDIVDHPKVWSSSIVIAFSIAMFNLCVAYQAPLSLLCARGGTDADGLPDSSHSCGLAVTRTCVPLPLQCRHPRTT